MELSGPDRHNKRRALYAADGRFELTFCGGGYSDPNYGYYYDGRHDDRLKRSAGTFPDWAFFDISIISTDEPHTVFVECGGRGMRYSPTRDEPHYYENHYLLSFILKDGKIKLLRKIFNPYQCMLPANEMEIPEGF